MKAHEVLLVLAAAAALSCEARRLAVSDVVQVPEDDNMDTVFSVEERPALPALPPVYPVAPDHLEPYDPLEDVPAVPHPLSKRSTVVFRPLFATRERDAERREQHERRREYWDREQRRRSAVAHPAPAPAYRAYPGAYSPAYPGAYPTQG